MIHFWRREAGSPDCIDRVPAHRGAEQFRGSGATARTFAADYQQNIAELEAHVGARLINRTTRRMALTEEGRIYLEHVTRGLEALAEADQALCPIKTEPSGTLRVSAPVTVTRLSTAIPSFLARYPALKLDLHLDDRRVDIVREGVDLAIRCSDNLEDSSLIAHKLAVIPHVLCAAPSYCESMENPGRPLI